MVNLAGLAPRAALRAVTAVLEAAGCPDAAYDAGVLYALAAGPGRDPRLDAAPLAADAAATLAQLAERRAAREPLQYIAGAWDFLDFTLKVGPGVLCPRPDTEVVCEAAVELLRGMDVPAPRVLDLCAGTGCLGLGVKRFVPPARVTCVEKSPAAFAYLQVNAANALAARGLAVEAVQADAMAYAAACPAGSVELVVSNPPYLTAAEMADLQPETAREPAMALDGGADGLDFYRALASACLPCLRPGGWLVFEIGWRQQQAVEEIGRRAGWQNIAARRDYGGNPRAVWMQKAPAKGLQINN